MNASHELEKCVVCRRAYAVHQGRCHYCQKSKPRSLDGRFPACDGRHFAHAPAGSASPAASEHAQ